MILEKNIKLKNNKKYKQFKYYLYFLYRKILLLYIKLTFTPLYGKIFMYTLAEKWRNNYDNRKKH